MTVAMTTPASVVPVKGNFARYSGFKIERQPLAVAMLNSQHCEKTLMPSRAC